MASTGMRIGAVPNLRIRNLEKYNGSYKITVYENSKEEYITFCTPECFKAIESYLQYRERYGEKLRGDTFLIREIFNTRDTLRSANNGNRKMSVSTLTKQLMEVGEKAGLRVRGKSAADKKDIMANHGLRKFFATVCDSSKVNPEIRERLLGHNIGLALVYVKPSVEDIYQEYEKAMDNLTIDPSNRLQKKVETLENEKDIEIAKLNTKLANMTNRVDRLVKIEQFLQKGGGISFEKRNGYRSVEIKGNNLDEISQNTKDILELFPDMFAKDNKDSKKGMTHSSTVSGNSISISTGEEESENDSEDS
jgi:hypothetical protein